MKTTYNLSKNMRKFNALLLALFVMLLFTACDNTLSPLKKPEKKQPPVSATSSFGLVRVTFSDIGSGEMSAKASFVNQPTETTGNHIAASLTALNSIQMRPKTHGTFTLGDPGSGLRYIYATFEVRNAQSDGTAYTTDLENLTFIAVDTDGTHGVTPVETLRKFNGDLISGATAETIAAATIPTGRAMVDYGNIEPVRADILQVFTEIEADNFQAGLPGATTVNDVFPYGFITESYQRELPANPGPFDYRGTVTFAYKMPLNADPAEDPFEISVVFMPVSDSEITITQSLEEQTAAGLQNFKSKISRFDGLGAFAGVNLLPGSLYYGGAPSNFICTPVRVAGSDGGADEVGLFPTPPVFSFFSPNPYISATGFLTNPVQFQAGFIGSPLFNPPNTRTFTIQGYQSGSIISSNYIDDGSGTITSPISTYFPGEVIEVAATRGLGTCDYHVAQFRIATAPEDLTTYTLSTVASVGDQPRSIVSGDFNGDGNLDLATVNKNDDTITVLFGDGSGGFPLSSRQVITISPFPVEPEKIVGGDFNGDGKLDMAVIDYIGYSIGVTLNEGGGNFGPVKVYRSLDMGRPQLLHAGDFNGDGNVDLLSSAITEPQIALLFNNGFGELNNINTQTISFEPASIAIADFNNDGDLDFVGADKLGDQVIFFTNDGLGTFTESPAAPFSVRDFAKLVSAGDFNGDGYQDVAVSFKTTPGNFEISILLNDGDGTFDDPAGEGEYAPDLGHFPEQIVTGDFDGDGDLDIISFDNSPGAINILSNNGSGVFTNEGALGGLGTNPVWLTTGDFDGNGTLDLASANEGSDDVTVLTN